MILPLHLGKDSYDIVLERGCLNKAGELLNLNRRVLVVTDDGIPEIYAKTIASFCKAPVLVTLPQGETAKCFDQYLYLLRTMLQNGFDRKDCCVAVGGGVVGDLTGFAAAGYMRGIDFYNVPTTVLSQVDSSIGGKVAIDLDGVKNIVGAFYQPKKVLVDPSVLSTLPPRQVSNGLAEAVKMAVTFDEKGFCLFEKGNPLTDQALMEQVIKNALTIKKNVVEQDEKENGLRKALNFGHTLGHGIESGEGLTGLYHGECVALGMLPMCSKQVRARLLPVLQKLGLPTVHPFDESKVLSAVSHDKKSAGNTITIIRCEKIGSFVMENATSDDLRRLLEEMR